MSFVSLTVLTNGEGKWSDMRGREVIEPTEAIQIAGLPNGMQSGLPSVAFRIELPDGKIVFAQTSLRLFLTAADMLKGFYGDPRT